ncbi:LysR family transcriptional regulator [Vibrio caribbeanicus]|uniref:Transcriptional regulator n=1 Tax=Vibrio caribbeanicus ATCC BAA-2122 TaxID=796620 RepID=E3BL23_9VIBR|nr:LysR family transcriptional regulator [Vibrio caribbeanicus]EFP96367.1 transcriptional regulator [Vibrio caribbeanicus ATCC BAA-2122]
MDTRFLQTLLVVAEQGSIAAAARSQHLTPAAISQRVQSLEKELNCQLFRRAGNTVQPTDICLGLIPKVERLIKDTQDVVDSVRDSALSGTLRIGANSTSLTAFIPGSLKSVRRCAPEANFQVIPGNSIDLYRSLQEGNLDAAIIVKPPSSIPKTCRYWVLRREPLVFIHPRSKQGAMEETLLKHEYIRFDPACWGGLIVERFLNERKLKLQNMFDLDSLEAIAHLVCEDVGVSIVPMWPGLEGFKEKLNIHTIEESRYWMETIIIAPIHSKQPRLLNIFLNNIKKMELSTHFKLR